MDCNIHAPARHADRLTNAFLKLGYWVTAEDVPVPVIQALGCARLVPFWKKGSEGLRPIAVGEVWRRLISKVMIANDSSVAMIQSLAPLQVGIGVAGACELIAMGAAQAMRSGDWKSVWTYAFLLGPPEVCRSPRRIGSLHREGTLRKPGPLVR